MEPGVISEESEFTLRLFCVTSSYVETHQPAAQRAAQVAQPSATFRMMSQLSVIRAATLYRSDETESLKAEGRQRVQFCCGVPNI